MLAWVLVLEMLLALVWLLPLGGLALGVLVTRFGTKDSPLTLLFHGAMNENAPLVGFATTVLPKAVVAASTPVSCPVSASKARRCGGRSSPRN